MNDHPDLTPAQEESVRRLLADARATDPVPADVGERLDGVLRELADERREAAGNDDSERQESQGPPDDNVVDLSARRRARIRNVLVAAAAVVAIGVAAPQVIQGGMDVADDSAAESSGSAGSDEDSAFRADEEGPAAETAPESAPEPAQTDSQAPTRLTIRAESFEADAERAREDFGGSDALTGTTYLVTCLPAVELNADSTQIPVRFGGQDAVLVLEPVTNGSQRVSLYVCGETSPRRTALLDPR